MGRVIVVGSINVDFTVHTQRLPRPGETVTGGTFQRGGGGKGANQAVAAARAGAATIFIGAVGADDLGESALAELTAEGIDTSRCLRLPGTSTGIALITVDAAGDNQIAVASGANHALGAGEVAAALAGVDGNATDVLLTSREVPDGAVRAALMWAADHGCRAVLNPAPARALDHALLGFHPILTPNRVEAAALTGKTDPEEAARAMPGPVVVTLGADGALLVDAAGTTTRIPALPVTAVDATGAGDALNGILAAELAAGLPLELALRRAVIGASLSTTKPGARAGMPTSQEIDLALSF